MGCVSTISYYNFPKQADSSYKYPHLGKHIDEYNDEYDWEAFDERVLKFNGGIYGVEPREKIVQDPSPNSRWYDPNMPDTRPISHFEYAHGRYSYDYYKDPEGYEFTRHEFS